MMIVMMFAVMVVMLVTMRIMMMMNIIAMRVGDGDHTGVNHDDH